MSYNFHYFELIFFLFIFNASLDLEAKIIIKQGEFKLSASLEEFLDEESQKTYSAIINADEMIEWEVYLPLNYQADKNPGLMVYISPTRSGEIPNSWIPLMEEYNLIWVSANDSGNNIDPRKRLIKAILASTIVSQKYPLNLKRVYVSGFSGGGRMASIVASQFPQLFKGAIYNCGVNYWNNLTNETLEILKKNRFVFITGRNDFNLEDTKKVFRKYKKAGVENIKLLINPIMGHSNPNKKDLEAAIKYLDEN